MQIDPRVSFVIGILVTLETAVGGGLISLTHMIPADSIPTVTAWCNALAFAGSAILTGLHGFSSGNPGPLAPPSTQAQTIANAAAKLVLPLAALLALGCASQARADTMDWVFPVVSSVLFDVTKFAYDSGLLPVVLLLLLWAGIAAPVVGIAYIGRTIWRRGAPVASAIALAIGLALVLASHPAAAQTAPQRVAPKLTGNPIQDIKAAAGQGSSEEAKLTGDPVADLHAVIAKGGAKLILHLKQTYALASAPGADGVMIDPVSAPCAKALVPIVDLVVNGPKMGAITAPDPMAMSSDELAMNADTTQIEGLPVKIEKLRILRISLTSQALTIACGPLVQDEVKQAKNLIGGITSLMTGAGLLGIGL